MQRRVIQLAIKKHRDGVTGQTLLYQFDFNTGNFNYVPSTNDGVESHKRNERARQMKKEYKDSEDVF